MEEAAADLISDIVRDRHLNSPALTFGFSALPLHEKVRFIVSIPTYIFFAVLKGKRGLSAECRVVLRLSGK